MSYITHVVIEATKAGDIEVQMDDWATRGYHLTQFQFQCLQETQYEGQSIIYMAVMEMENEDDE